MICDVKLTTMPGAAWPEFAHSWGRLVEQRPAASVFLRQEWTDTWLSVYGPGLDVSIAAFTVGAELVGACLVVQNTIRRYFIPVRRLALNASGESQQDAAYLEFNDLLCQPGWEPCVAAALARYLRTLHFDELRIDGLVFGPTRMALCRALPELTMEEDIRPSYHVDLAALRCAGASFADSLGKQSRKHLRQNLREYARDGEVRLEEAKDIVTSLALFEEMAQLNRQRRRAQGLSTIFDSPLFLTFHQKLIRRYFGHNLVRLARVCAGDKTVGVVYNLICGDTVYFYQSGFDYSRGAHLSPGLVTLAEVIGAEMEQGFRRFDLLAGSEAYKQRLATGSEQLTWMRFRRPGLKSSAVIVARAAKRQLDHWVHRPHSRSPEPASRPALP